MKNGRWIMRWGLVCLLGWVTTGSLSAASISGLRFRDVYPGGIAEGSRRSSEANTAGHPEIPSGYENAETLANAKTADQVKVEVTVSAETVLIAEPVVVRIDVVAPDEMQVVLPVVGETWGEWEVVSSSSPSMVLETSQRRWSASYQLESLQTGTLEIPAMEVQVIDEMQMPSKQTRSIATRPIMIEVTSTLDDSADPMQPEPPAGAVSIANETLETTSWAGGVVVLVGALLAVLVLLLSLRKRNAMSFTVWAASELIVVRDQWQQQRSDDGETLADISRVLRECVAGMSGRAGAITSQQAVAWMADRDETAAAELNQILSRADEVSYAGVLPSADEIRDWFDRADAWVATVVPLENEPKDLAKQAEAEA